MLLNIAVLNTLSQAHLTGQIKDYTTLISVSTFNIISD